MSACKIICPLSILEIKKKLNIVIVLIAFFNFGVTEAQVFKKKRHSITPMFGLANNSITPFSLSPSPDLKIEYSNGDNWRIPFTLRYQYRMNHGNRFGVDFLGNYNPIILTPKYYSAKMGYVGPTVLPNKGQMLGGDIHYSKTIDIKLIEVFGFIGIGGYWQFPDNTQTENFNWYKNADSIFYDFAKASTFESARSFLPITTFGFGARFKHLEGGLNYQFSLMSPVNSFEYEGVTFRNHIRFQSLGYYAAYRFEF